MCWSLLYSLVWEQESFFHCFALSNDFQIRFITQTALKDCTIEIFDTKGELKQFRELGEADLSNNLVKFDSHVLNTGIYFVKITTGGKISHHRILIRK